MTEGDWTTSKNMMAEGDFVQRLLQLNPAHIPMSVASIAAKLPFIQFENSARSLRIWALSNHAPSQCFAILAAWVHAILQFKLQDITVSNLAIPAVVSSETIDMLTQQNERIAAAERGVCEECL